MDTSSEGPKKENSGNEPEAEKDSSNLSPPPTAEPANAEGAKEDGRSGNNLSNTSNNVILPSDLTTPLEKIEAATVISFKTNKEKFHYYMKDLESPLHFIDWNYLFLVSACLGRKIWIGAMEGFPIFANMFVVFVARPGFGKSLPANKSYEILSQLESRRLGPSGKMETYKMVNLFPQSITFERMIYRLVETTESIAFPQEEGKPKKFYTHTSVTFCQSNEMGTLFRDRTESLVALFTNGWDCTNFEQDTVSNKQKIIKNVCLNFLGCCVPTWLARNRLNQTLDEGFTSRINFVYGDTIRESIHGYYKISETQEKLLGEVKGHLRKLAALPPTALEFTEEALDYYITWAKEDYQRKIANKDKILDHFFGRRSHNLRKLALAVHYSEKLTPFIELEDLIAADKLLQTVELNMRYTITVDPRSSLYGLAMKIKELLRLEARPMTAKAIYLRSMEYAELGGTESIDKALDWLRNTDQVVVTTNKEGINYYELSL